MFRLYVFTCCLQRIFYNREKNPISENFFRWLEKIPFIRILLLVQGKKSYFPGAQGITLPTGTGSYLFQLISSISHLFSPSTRVGSGGPSLCPGSGSSDAFR